MSNNHHALSGNRGDARYNDRMARLKLSIVKRICKFCGHDKGIDSVYRRKCSRCKRDVL